MPFPLADLRKKLQRVERGRDRWALRWQVLLAIVDIAILAFFLLGPYLRTRPTYLIIDYSIALWIMGEMTARALAAPSFRVWIGRAMTWIDFVVLATLSSSRIFSTISRSCA